MNDIIRFEDNYWLHFRELIGKKEEWMQGDQSRSFYSCSGKK